MSLTMNQMLEDGLTPEDVDAITGPPMGHPKSASFRTADMVGLDTFKHVADNCYAALPDDEERDVFKLPEFMHVMVEKKILGNKTRGGFYKKTKEGIETFDPIKLEYRAKGGDEDIKKFCKGLKGSPGGPREGAGRERRPGREVRLEGALAHARLLGPQDRRDRRQRRRRR